MRQRWHWCMQIKMCVYFYKQLHETKLYVLIANWWLCGGSNEMIVGIIVTTWKLLYCTITFTFPCANNTIILTIIIIICVAIFTSRFSCTYFMHSCIAYTNLLFTRRIVIIIQSQSLNDTFCSTQCICHSNSSSSCLFTNVLHKI